MEGGNPRSVPFIVVISGPSGAGKSSITRQVLDRHPEFTYSVSLTTRQARRNEKDGVDYRFTTEEEFLGKIEEGELVEWARVHGAYYGTPMTPIQEAFRRGKRVLLDIDVQGGKQLRDKFDQGVFIFVLPPTFQVLRERLCGRMTDPMEVIERRMKEVGREVEELRNYDYLVVNSDLDASVVQVEEIIRCEERKVGRIENVEEWVRLFRAP